MFFRAVLEERCVWIVPRLPFRLRPGSLKLAGNNCVGLLFPALGTCAGFEGTGTCSLLIFLLKFIAKKRDIYDKYGKEGLNGGGGGT